MNKLMCDHEFDMNSLLLSSPPQFRCIKCRVTAFQDEVLEYNARKVDAADVKDKKSEFWKSAALASINGSNRIQGADSLLIDTAIKVADDLVAAHEKRFR